MKILLIQDYLRSGGTERQTVALANAFAVAGHAVTLITFRPGGPLASTVSPAVTHHALQRFDTKLDWFAPGITLVPERFPADIILCMGRMANCYAQGLVKETRDRFPHTAVIGTMRTGKKLPWLFRSSLRAVRHIVANSRAAKETLATRYAVPADKISVIHNGLVFPTTTSTRNDSLRAAHGAAPNTTVMLDVAMFRPEKNQRELIAIAAGLPPDFSWQLWLAGDGPELKLCQALARELGVADRVIFPGFTRDPAPLYAAADLAVHASRSESLSNFLIEAQACGLPAVACQAQGVDECLMTGKTGAILPHGDRDGFRRAILQYAKASPEVRQQARDFAQQHFSAERQVQAYLDLFAQLTKLPS